MTFNHNDCLGELDRDTKGLIVVPENLKDKLDRPVNSKGYLVDDSGNIIENLDGNLMFEACKLH